MGCTLLVAHAPAHAHAEPRSDNAGNAGDAGDAGVALAQATQEEHGELVD